MWTPDGRYVGVVQRRENTLYSTAPGEGQRQCSWSIAKLPISIGSWSPGMRTLIYMLESPVTGPDLWAVDLQTNAARPLVQTAARESGGRVSSDGRWLAYFSNETGAFDLCLRPLAAQRAAVPDFDDQRARAGSRPGSECGRGTVASCSTVMGRR